MSVLSLDCVDGYRRFDVEACEAAGRSRAQSYRKAKPFPHIVMDDFIETDLLRQVARGYPSTEGLSHFDRDQERLKYQFAPAKIGSGLTLNLLAELNSRAFIGFLEQMTGIKGLIPDPHFAGGGLHLTRRGGHLGIHADFNLHDEMKLERRLNLIVYLNDDWEPSYGGDLELWDTDMKACEVKVAPQIGRAVVFDTALDSFHGHPDPLACPPDRDRRSIATYYYTALVDGVGDVPVRSTNFQPRPKSGDKADWASRSNHFINDWVPPRLQRYARRLNPLR